jgi:hypothetical protein
MASVPKYRDLDTVVSTAEAKTLHSQKSKPEPTEVKANLFPCLINHHAMNTYGGAGGIAPRITSALDGDEKSTSHPVQFYAGERSPRNPLDRPHSRIDAVKKTRLPPTGNRILIPWSSNLVA